MRNSLIVIFLIFTQFSFSQGLLTYSSLTIPDSLKKDADAVYQLEEMIVTVQSSSKMRIRLHNIVTILNKNGLAYANVRISVDKFYKLDEFNAKVYNNLGLEVSRYKKKDLNLEGTYDGITLASDNKMYDLDFPVPDFPCTIETDYELDISGYIDIPSWTFGASKASFKTSRLILKSSIPFNYKVYNSELKPLITEEEGTKTYRWELNNKTISEKESGSYGTKVSMPWVDVSPVEFSYDGFPGSMSSWKEFGKWSYPFYEETDPFPHERIDFFKGLIKNDKTEKEKISTLYKYLQKETRYVSIQFGIGGFKPFPVSFAEKKKYGDCKGLTHYMKNILTAVGIKSYAALINAGLNEYPVDPLFASSIFNHVILCVPLEKDTVWLECTSKLTEPGILGNFTENRNALLITENGGVLVNTPSSKSLNNQWLAKTNVELYDDGSALIHSRILVSGEFWEYLDHYTDSKTKDEIKNALVNSLGYKAPDEFELKVLGDSANGHLLQLDLAYSKLFDFKAGAKHFFPLRQYKLNDETIKTAESRKFEYLFDFPYIKSDSTVYKLPGNFKKENLPAIKEIKNNFVFYKNEVQINETGDELKVVTQLTLNKHIIPAKQFNAVANSFEAIKKDEGQKLVLRKE